MRAGLLLVLAALVVAGCSSPPKAPAGAPPAASGPNPLVEWQTAQGNFTAELYLDKTPVTVQNFLNLTRDGFYDGTRFHRVMDGFMIQDGDPNTKDLSKESRWGTGGPGYTIVDEFPCKDGTMSHKNIQYNTRDDPCAGRGGLLLKHADAGYLSMANAGPGTGGSQYFVTLAETSNLDGTHTVFGKVTKGLDVVVKLGKVPVKPNPFDPRRENSRPVDPGDVLIHRIVVLPANATAPASG